jgi:DNA helicase II / ATP-dependent DNA helicase PcrA
MSKFIPSKYQSAVYEHITNGNGNAVIDAVCRRIESIFKDDQKSGICLSSVHKAKGLEADNVFILLPEKFYNKRAMRIEWMAEQETNLVYVAYTRAKHLLGFIAENEFKMD